MVETNVKDSERIKGLGFSSFIYSIFIASFLGMTTVNIYTLSKVDSYISALLGGIIGIIPLLLILYIIKNSDGDDIIDLNIKIFGKVLGTILNIILNIVFILFSALILYNLSLFLNTQYMADTNSLYVKILVMVAVVYAASKDIATISRISQTVLIINLIIFSISAIGVMTEIDLNNLLPILSDGIKPVAWGGIQYAIFGAMPLILLTAIPLKKVESKKSVYKNIWIIYAIVNIAVFLMFILTIGVLGYEVVSVYDYPEYMVLKTFSLFGIVERVENTLAIQFVFSMSISIILSIYMCSRSLKKIFKKIRTHQMIPNILGIITIILSSILFDNSTYAMEFISKYIPYIFGITFGILILMLVIGISVRKIMNKKKSKVVLVINDKEKVTVESIE